jgi:suppressor of G2 allele of SKP1
VSYTNGDKTLVLEPLKGQVVPDKSDFSVGKVKVELRLHKAAAGRWGGLVGDAPDREQHHSAKSHHHPHLETRAALANSSAPTEEKITKKQPRKNWDGITTKILEGEKDKSTEEDPNTGGDAAVNGFFQQLYANADEDTKRAMLKSYQESGGTALSTNWAEVGKGKVEVKPPQGSEWKKWAS